MKRRNFLLISLIFLFFLFEEVKAQGEEAILYNPDGESSGGVYTYVQGVVGDRATIMWQTRKNVLKPASFPVFYGLDSGNLNLQAADAVSVEVFRVWVSRERPSEEREVWVHRVEINGLEPGRKYYYQIDLPGVPEDKRKGEFITDPGPEAQVRMLFGADVFDAPKAFEHLEGNRGEIHLVLHAGDVGQGRLWGEWVKKCPFYIARGNHDKGGILEGSDFPGRDCPGNKNEHVYSFDYGPCHFIFLDFWSNLSSSEFLNWLESDLQGTSASWKIVVLHSSLFDAGGLFVRADESDWGGHHSFRYHVAPLLEKYGVDLVLSGHNHSYDRTYPVTTRGGIPVRNDSQGIVYIVASTRYTGGGSTTAFPWTAETDLPRVDTRSDEEHHIYLEVDRERLVVKYIRYGRERDYYLKVKSPTYENELINRLSSSDEEVVKSALKELGALGSRKAVPSILALLDSASDDLKVALMEALAGIGDKGVLGVTNEYLNSGRVEIRRSAVKLLARYGQGQEAISQLWAAVEDRDKEVGSWAVLGLIRLAGGTNEVNNLVEDWFREEDCGELGYERGLPDEDRDGIPRWYEVTTHLRADQNDANGDLDGDGLTNYEEYLLYTSANSVDTDGDGVNDRDDPEPRNPEFPSGIKGRREQTRRPILLSYPNPFNPECYIPLNIKGKMQNVKCKIYNILGQLVREIECSKVQELKDSRVYWDGRDTRGLEVPAGVYFYEVAGEAVRKMIILK
jgi:hypothetical protein